MIIQSNCLIETNQKSKHVIKGTVQMPLKHCDRFRALTTSPGSLFQCLISLSEMLPNVQFDPSLAQLCTIPTDSITGS